ncbi:MAG: hypothetical protein HQL41_05055 [Alphaproteobacteria bacterium]|nr:hypothetical protein [Alphaproteobacteria bacterium]
MPAPAKQDRHYQALHNLLFEVCRENHVQIEISQPKLVDAVVHYCRDMQKLDDHQGPHISANKRIAGLVFWVRRIKPISFACKVNSEEEIQDINEQAAVWLAHRLLLIYCESKRACRIIQDCNVTKKRAEFDKYLRAHWRLDNWINYSSLVYSLRYRNFSPHHLTILFDTLTTGFVLKHTTLLQ